jgi:hypothetical protein
MGLLGWLGFIVMTFEKLLFAELRGFSQVREKSKTGKSLETFFSHYAVPGEFLSSCNPGIRDRHMLLTREERNLVDRMFYGLKAWNLYFLSP